jgi:FkbM family methyltransferase
MYAVSSDGHSYDPDILQPGGWALDVGCRGFEFSRLMVEEGLWVIAVDADPEVGVAMDPNIRLLHFALIGVRAKGHKRPVTLYRDGDAGAYNIFCGEPHTVLSVPGKTLEELMQELRIGFFEIIKLDCEGAEYSVLENWPGPIAREISVEFHDFIGRNPEPDPEIYYRRMLVRLSKWYHVAKHIKAVPTWGGEPTYADSLFTLKTNLCL